MTGTWKTVISLTSLALLPTRSWGQAVQTGKDASSTAIAKGRLGGSATFSNDLGIGTFVINDGSDDPYFAQSLRLLPNYGLFQNVSAQADGKINWEWTSPSDPGAGPTGRHVTPEDIFLRLVHSSLYRERVTDINLSGAFSAALPISFESRWRNYITRLTATAGLDRTFIKRLTTTYTFAMTKYFPTSNVAGDTDNDLCSPGQVCAARGPVNPNFAFRNQFGVAYAFTDRLSASLTLRFTTYLKYKIGDSSEPENNDGYDNRHTYTISLGDISANYRITDRYSAAAGVTSEQYTSDSQGNPRFPFADFETSKENYTTLYVSGTATF